MKLFISILFIGLTISSYAQDLKSQGILNNLSNKMKGQKTFYIEFSAIIKNTTTGLNEKETGKGWVKGNKFYASFGSNTMISNGLKNWTVVKEDKMVYISKASEDDEMNPKKLMTIWENGFSNSFVKESKIGKTSVFVIKLKPKSKNSDYKSVMLYVAKDYSLKKVVLKTQDGTTMSYSLLKFNGNLAIDDKKFVYDKTKYPGHKSIRD
jgi:outer membrane lipoprotein-sorting protein